jgi:hypothetical protein
VRGTYVRDALENRGRLDARVEARVARLALAARHDIRVVEVWVDAVLTTEEDEVVQVEG